MAKAIVGGLLQGLGSGMVAQAEVNRQDALERARERRRQRERDEDRQFTLERDQSNREFQGGLLSRVDTDAEGRRIGITRSGETKDLGYRAPMDDQAGSGSGGSSGIDNAQLNTLERISRNFWGTMNENGQYFLPEGSQENYTETLQRAEALVMAGMPAGRAANVAALSIAGPLDEQTAKQQALKEAKEQGVSTPGVFSGGDTEWIERRTQELMQESREAERLYNQAVGGGQSGGGSAARPQAESGQQANTAPPGQGSRSDPYKATAQAHIDWFRESAPEGAVIEVNGKLYTK